MLKLNLFILIFTFSLIGKAESFSLQPIDIQSDKKSYTLETPVPNEFLESYRRLSENEKQSFLKTRQQFLTVAAKALEALKIGFGLGIAYKDKLHFKRQENELLEWVKDSIHLDEASRADILRAAQEASDTLQEKKLQSQSEPMKKKVHQVFTNILTQLDLRLWSQSPIVAHANEFGVVLSLGAVAEMGTKEKGRGGVFDIGLSLTYNRDEKAVVFQVFRNAEKFVSTPMPGFGVIGLIGKAGLLISHYKPDIDVKGSTFYPPMAPSYLYQNDSKFHSGLNLSLTWPPSPIAEMMTYTNSSDERVWLRLTVSPLIKGFVHLQSGVFKDIQSVKVVTLDWIKQFLHKPNRLHVGFCEALF